MKKRNVLILGASYGSLLATKLSMAGHSVIAGLHPRHRRPDQPRRHRWCASRCAAASPIEIPSSLLPGALDALHARSDADPADYDLVVLGMQEAQYGARRRARADAAASPRRASPAWRS